MTEEVKGMDELLEQFRDIENLDWVKAEVQGMTVIKDEAQRIVPVDTGALRKTIRVEVQGETVMLLAGGDEVDYHLHVEFGTVKMKAQPYMRPAIDTKQKECVKAIAANLEEQIKDRV